MEPVQDAGAAQRQPHASGGRRGVQVGAAGGQGVVLRRDEHGRLLRGRARQVRAGQRGHQEHEGQKHQRPRGRHRVGRAGGAAQARAERGVPTWPWRRLAAAGVGADLRRGARSAEGAHGRSLLRAADGGRAGGRGGDKWDAAGRVLRRSAADGGGSAVRGAAAAATAGVPAAGVAAEHAKVDGDGAHAATVGWRDGTRDDTRRAARAATAADGMPAAGVGPANGVATRGVHGAAGGEHAGVWVAAGTRGRVADGHDGGAAELGRRVVRRGVRRGGQGVTRRAGRGGHVADGICALSGLSARHAVTAGVLVAAGIWSRGRSEHARAARRARRWAGRRAERADGEGAELHGRRRRRAVRLGRCVRRRGCGRAAAATARAAAAAATARAA